VIARLQVSADDVVASAGAVLALGSRDIELELRVEQPRGEPDEALRWEDVEEKYRALAGAVFDEDRCAQIAAWVKRLPSADPVGALTALLRAPA